MCFTFLAKEPPFLLCFLVWVLSVLIVKPVTGKGRMITVIGMVKHAAMWKRMDA